MPPISNGYRLGANASTTMRAVTVIRTEGKVGQCVLGATLRRAQIEGPQSAPISAIRRRGGSPCHLPFAAIGSELEEADTATVAPASDNDGSQPFAPGPPLSSWTTPRAESRLGTVQRGARSKTRQAAIQATHRPMILVAVVALEDIVFSFDFA